MPVPRPSLADPRILAATALGTGYLPAAPGTWASLLAAVAAWPIAAAGGWPLLLAAAAAVSMLGIPAIAAYHRASGRIDPGEVTIDEVAGQWLALAACPLDPLWWLAGFVAFRVFDIVKPPPVRWADRRFKTAVGVMLDDVLAGLYAVAVLLAARWALAPSI
ncbi:MAG: phosphatidylglycerophosphatase A [Thalassobaculum sp.]|uniref:phosphatidylglycerophosphatase A family protein n=1 Tax=Thalassobaculum sp. TaxID=2022740 RepID=UPI0032EB8377